MQVRRRPIVCSAFRWEGEVESLKKWMSTVGASFNFVKADVGRLYAFINDTGVVIPPGSYLLYDGNRVLICSEEEFIVDYELIEDVF